MKLSRQSTTESDKFQKESTPFGDRSSELLRGRKHHFLVENATAAELEAMDDLLRETEFGENCDGCPVYDEGYSCGWWIAIEDVPTFKAEYKRLKCEVAARIEANKAVAVDKALAEMSDEQVAILDRVAYNVRTDLLTEGSTVASLRNVNYRTPVVNPFHNARNPLTPELWELVEQCLIIGKNETCASLRILEGKTCAEIRRRREAAENEIDAGFANERPNLVNMTENEIGALAELVHDEALEINRVMSEGLSFEAAFLNIARRGVEHMMTFTPEEVALWAAAELQSQFYLLSTDAQAYEVEKSHDLARKFSRLIGNADLLPEFWHKYRLTPADVDFILVASQRQYPDLWESDLEDAHTRALEEDNEFDGIICDGLTTEQRAIQIRREGTDIYGENYFGRQMDEAYAYDLKRNQAIRDEAYPLKKPVEFRNRQYLWEEVYNEDYKTARLDVAHAAALEMNRDRMTLKEFVRQSDDLAPAHPELVAALNGTLAEDTPIHQTRKKE